MGAGPARSKPLNVSLMPCTRMAFQTTRPLWLYGTKLTNIAVIPRTLKGRALIHRFSALLEGELS